MRRRVIRATLLILTLAMLLAAVPARAQSVSRHLALGNPSGAIADPAFPDNYLIVRDQYALGYRRDDGIPAWVSWHLQAADLGTEDRYSGDFITDTSLPAGWYRVVHDDYTNSGYDRGHMTPSADRTATAPDNEATFILTNILPQAPANNRGPWKALEDATRDLINLGNEAYIVSGGDGRIGTLAGGKIRIPAATWKVMIVLPVGDNDASRVTTDTTVIAVRMPNDASATGDWNSYRTSVDCIEGLTGLDFFANVDDTVEATIEAQGGDCIRLYLPAIIAPASEPAPQPLVTIAEVIADPPGVDVDGEYVRIINSGAGAAEMTGWTLADEAGSTFTFPAFMLAPGAELRVWVKAGVNDATNLYWGRSQAVWNNDGDTATLRDSGGGVIDQYTYP